MTSEQKCLQYVPFTSFVDPGFWFKLTEIKIDIDKLKEERRKIWGTYSNTKTTHEIALMDVDCTSFNSSFGHETVLPAHGYILNKNTIESFKECNKLALIDNEGLILWEKIKNGDALKDPSILNSFFVLSFADLKKYHYYYWFAFPTPNNFKVFINNNRQQITDVLSIEEITNLLSGYCDIKESKQKTFFIINKSNLKIFTFNAAVNKLKDDSDFDSYYFAFSDPCKNEKYPGWPLRNYLLALMYHCQNIHGQDIKILSFRLHTIDKMMNCNNSIVFNVKLSDISVDFEEHLYRKSDEVLKDSTWFGWEKNERGKFGPQRSDMSNQMDPVTLCRNAVDLNLKLMKWRIVSDIDLEKLNNTKCLLLGSGALGCSVARTLLAWGFRNINFVDNGKVSYSNPVRQNLFTYEDCLNGGKPKAKAAAENLKKIFPFVSSDGHQFMIPMLNHPVEGNTKTEIQDSVDSLTDLIKQHDLIFLLTDSKKSHWLPTLLGACYGKIVINAALGFDTYQVMRHGCRLGNINNEPLESLLDTQCISGDQLSCYFCNNRTTAGDSSKSETLDQQCTVTRPGISQIAGSLAVELAVSVLQHKKGVQAPAYYKSVQNDITTDIDTPNQCVLGIIPHSIEGSLSKYMICLPATEQFKNCIACSDLVINEYKKDGFEFLIKAFNSCKYLEDLTRNVHGT